MAHYARNTHSASEDYSVTLKFDLTLSRTADTLAPDVRIVRNDPTAQKVTLPEDQLLATYPWDFKELIERLKSRYTDFKQNMHLYKLRKDTEEIPGICHTRNLEYRNQRGCTEKYYNSNTLSHFDNH